MKKIAGTILTLVLVTGLLGCSSAAESKPKVYRKQAASEETSIANILENAIQSAARESYVNLWDDQAKPQSNEEAVTENAEEAAKSIETSSLDDYRVLRVNPIENNSNITEEDTGEDEEEEDEEDDELTNLEGKYVLPGISDMILADSEVLRVCVDSVEPNNSLGYLISFSVKNKTEKQMSVYINDVRVDGLHCFAYAGAVIEPAKTERLKLYIETKDFDRAGIIGPEKIRFVFSAYDWENWTQTPYLKHDYELSPVTGREYRCKGFDPEAYAEQLEKPFTPVRITGKSEYDLVVYELAKKNAETFTLKCYLFNKTDEALQFKCEHLLINGWEQTVNMLETVDPGCFLFAEMNIDKESLDRADIQSFDTLNMLLKVSGPKGAYEAPLYHEYTSHKLGGIMVEGSKPCPCSEEKVLYSDKLTGVSVTVAPVEYSEANWEFLLPLYISCEDCEKDLVFYMEDVFLNGFEADSYWEMSVYRNARAYAPVAWTRYDIVGGFEHDLESVILTLIGYEPSSGITVIREKCEYRISEADENPDN